GAGTGHDAVLDVRPADHGRDGRVGLLGGQYGEITVALQYQFQAWNMHIPGKYRDLVFGIGAEEMGHVEMLATMIAQLLEKS
ncbi:manganese catalase family protein, partial [Pseudoalteromonas sp. CR1]|nr:manganese catalase family protein [Pseudoalteromonas sp. CR1]